MVRLALIVALILALTMLIMRPPPSKTGGVDLDDLEAIAAGEAIYVTRCTGFCHGYKGTAKQAPEIRNRPDLAADKLYRIIANGRKRAGRLMPAWNSELSSTEIWQVVAYIASLRDPQAVFGEPSN